MSPYEIAIQYPELSQLRAAGATFKELGRHCGVSLEYARQAFYLQEALQRRRKQLELRDAREQSR